MTTNAATVHEIRRDIHEALVILPAWDADKVRGLLDQLEAAVETRVREQVAQEIENNPGPIDGEWMDSRDRAAAARIARNGEQQ